VFYPATGTWPRGTEDGNPSLISVCPLAERLFPVLVQLLSTGLGCTRPARGAGSGAVEDCRGGSTPPAAGVQNFRSARTARGQCLLALAAGQGGSIVQGQLWMLVKLSYVRQTSAGSLVGLGLYGARGPD